MASDQDKALRELITRELTSVAASNIGRVARLRKDAADMLTTAANLEQLTTRMLDCDAQQAHKFETTPGSGMLGDRFEEKCTKCGWIHTC